MKILPVFWIYYFVAPGLISLASALHNSKMDEERVSTLGNRTPSTITATELSSSVSPQKFTCYSLLTRPGCDTIKVNGNVLPLTSIYTFVTNPRIENLQYSLGNVEPASASSLFILTQFGALLVASRGFTAKDSNKIYMVNVTIKGKEDSCKQCLLIRVQPRYFVNFTNSIYYARINANTGPLSYVTNVTAKGVEVFYEIINPNRAFQINQVTGTIKTTFNLVFDLNKNQNKMYEVTLLVRAYNRKHEVSATATVSITVMEANNIPPICSPDLVEKSVPETTPLHTVLFILKCKCYDGSNSSLSYQVVTNMNSKDKFSLENGLFKVNNTLTYDSAEMASVNFEYTASIIVKDVRYPKLSADVKVYITVTPVNQYYPQCHPPFSFTIKKNSPLSYPIGKVNATDRDWRFNNVRFSIIGGNPFPPLFTIDPQWGLIQLINTLQYEKRPAYKLEILIVDVNQDIIPDPINQKTTNCTITVNVEDTSITCYPWYIRTTICSTLPADSSVANLNCKSWNSDFSYEITGGNADQMFRVDQGIIFTKKTFNFLSPGIITPPNYEIHVVVSDNSQPYTSATVTVVIQVVYCTTTTVTTTHTTTHTTRTTRTATMVDYYWAPDPWFVAVMTVTGVLLLLLLLFIILKLLRRYGLCLPPPDEAFKPLLQENSFTTTSNEPTIESNNPIETGVHQTIKDETTMIVNQIPTEFDGKAVDPLTGKDYLYNSITGERRWI